MVKVSVGYKLKSLDEVFDEVKDSGCGAVILFIGTARDLSEGKEVLYLEYEAYEEMAKKEIERICEDAKRKFGLKKVVVLHKLGRVEPGEIAVIVGVSSEHRKEGFEGCKYIMDRIKERVPIWKKEVFKDGERWVE